MNGASVGSQVLLLLSAPCIRRRFLFISEQFWDGYVYIMVAQLLIVVPRGSIGCIHSNDSNVLLCKTCCAAKQTFDNADCDRSSRMIQLQTKQRHTYGDYPRLRRAAPNVMRRPSRCHLFFAGAGRGCCLP